MRRNRSAAQDENTPKCLHNLFILCKDDLSHPSGSTQILCHLCQLFHNLSMLIFWGKAKGLTVWQIGKQRDFMLEKSRRKMKIIPVLFSHTQFLLIAQSHRFQALLPLFLAPYLKLVIPSGFFGSHPTFQIWPASFFLIMKLEFVIECFDFLSAQNQLSSQARHVLFQPVIWTCSNPDLTPWKKE